MSPARSHAEQTRNTLLFASCARQVSTNAQVNAIMSDKALVKQLQKELARLENELRTSLLSQRRSNSNVEVLKEKDLEIEKLRTEISDLTLQRDLAQSQIKDMLQVVGDDLSSFETESMEIRYPELRERKSWDFDNQADEQQPTLFSLDSFDKIKYFQDSMYSDGNSFSSSDDNNFFQLPDLEKNLPLRVSPLILPILTPEVDSNRINNAEEQQKNDNFTKQKVKCMVDSEDTISDSSVSSPEPRAARPPVKKLADIERDFIGFPSQKMVSPPKPYSKMTRSTSCKASIMRDPGPDWFDEEDVAHQYATPPLMGMGMGMGKDFLSQRHHVVGFPSSNDNNKLHTLNYDADGERVSPFCDGNNNNSPLLESGSVGSENHVRRVTFKDIDANGSLLGSEGEEKVDLESSNNLPGNHEESKDDALVPKQSNEEKNSNWPEEFKRLQREIVELWDACNVSLVHRSYFFLLFKGDPSDSIYMEVELRSAKALRKERQMLSKKMRKKLSKSERNKLYVEWRIDRHSKHRRLHLAHLLWSEIDDMDRVRVSATIVARLVGSVEPDQAYKEMFGLNFAVPRLKPKKSFGWRSSTMKKHIL
ncbi:hypothetical protein PIB30_061409 [Stylosanthes scabra]|uniref:Kinesin motor domain-containing protein n=1 Tax=Stylosanthes scabra TaxID=79078 RepID=A0ABU6UN94_9FABA|nr:hypothetical protein [Stylosanthes scabra]